MKHLSKTSAMFVAVAAVLALLPLPGNAGTASRDGVWRQSRAVSNIAAGGSGKLYTLNRAKMSRILGRAGRTGTHSRTVVSLPLPDGTYTRVRVERSPVVAASVRAKRIATFVGRGLTDKTIAARLDLTPSGFHAQVFTAAGTAYIDPVDATGSTGYRSAWGGTASGIGFACTAGEAAPVQAAAPSVMAVSGETLRTYRLAVTATGEYTAALGGASAVSAQIATTVNRLNGIFEREAGIRFVVVAENIYEDAATDPFPAGDVLDDALLDQNQADLDAKYGVASYDIGHILTLATGVPAGLASIASVCSEVPVPVKARGGSALPVPPGTGFDVDLVAHEVGHQLGAHHTFNGTSGSCGGARAAETAFEPGSGSTLMSFAGGCADEDVQPHRDDYLHTASFDEIVAFRDGAGSACGEASPTGNLPPAVDAGTGTTIPRGTPFTLVAVGSDPDGDPLTFCWEQLDLGAASPPPNTVDGPLFRSLPPVAEPARTFPALADLLAGTTSPWETLPGFDRSLNFRVTARDSRSGVSYDTVTLTVAGDPFAITAPAAGEVLECGAQDELLWNVGGGSVAAVVRPLVSTDGGATFGPLSPETANDGAEIFTVPQVLTAAGRVKLEAVDNVFFALSGAFSIADTLPPVVTAPGDVAAECTSPLGTDVEIGTATAADLCDAAVSVVSDAPELFPLGMTEVLWSATDASGHTGTDLQTVTVVDTTAPTVTAPPDIVAECTSPLGTDVEIGMATAVDLCDATLTVVNNAPELFPLGMTEVLWSATDDSGHTGTDLQTVTVVDTTPPVITVAVTPSRIWPPNHKMVTVRATITVVEACDAAPAVRIVSIASDEPENGRGDGNTAPDVIFDEDDLTEFQVRAERSGGGDGRVYTVTYEAVDASGNVGRGQATITVPHDMR